MARKSKAKRTEQSGNKAGKEKRAGLGARLRGYLLAGTLVTAPFAITIYLAWLFIRFVDDNVMVLVPDRWSPDTYLRFGLPGLGLIITILFLILVGWLAAGYLGRVVLRAGEKVMQRMPVLRSIYNAAKQILESIMSQQSKAFRQVVLVEFPRKGVWTIGFITGEASQEVYEQIGEDLVGVMVPTTPNPTSGYLLYVRPAEIKYLDMSVEEGMKQVISVGTVGAKKALPAAEQIGTETAGAAEAPRVSEKV